MKRWTLGLLAAVSLGFAVLAPDIPAEFPPAERIVAVGDVHGAYDRFVHVLQASGVIDRKLRWTGGSTHLVQTGDMTDRGPESRKALDLLRELEPQAEAAGGRVHALIGNHEFWNAVGELTYVSEQEYRAFDGPRDRELRKAQGADAVQPGLLALREAFGPEGEYGRWIRTQNAAVRIGDYAFVHGGITPEVAEMGLAEINRRVRADLDLAVNEWQKSFAIAQDGPLMTRRYSEEDLRPEDEERLAAELDGVLQKVGARTMVMGHTVTYGLIEPRFGGRAILIDTGMLDLYLGGREAALLIEGESRYAIYERGRVELPPDLGGEAGGRYVEQAVAASPRDSALKQRLAMVRRREGKLSEAAKIYEELNVLEPRTRVPPFWRREAARVYEELGQAQRSRDLSSMYLKALGTQAERMGPAGVPLLHHFARESLQLGLMAPEALSAARQVVRAYPENLSFQTTLAWAYLENGQAEGASYVLRAIIDRGGDGFEAQYLLGRAHLALGDEEKALEAFRSALRHRPDSKEAQEAVAKLGGEPPPSR